MPTIQEYSTTIRQQQQKWITEHIEAFLSCMSSTKNLCNAFISREFLLKNNSIFPTEETPFEELLTALDAINKGDITVYQRRGGDAERPLIIIEEPEFGLKDTVRRYMSPSTALSYDAAAFHALTCLQEENSFASTYRKLIDEFPESDLVKEYRSASLAFKTALAKEILKCEQLRAYEKIVDDPMIPESFKTAEIHALNAVSSLPLLKRAVVKLNEKYLQIIRVIKEQNDLYEEAKAKLRIFLTETTHLPTTLKQRGGGLLGSCDERERRQALSLFSLESARMIYEFQAESRHEMNEIQMACRKAKQMLETTLTQTNIRDAFKVHGRSLLAVYNEAETTASPLDALLVLAKGLQSECEAICANEKEERRRETLQLEYSTAVGQLQTIVANQQIPAQFKTKAIALLRTPWTSANSWDDLSRTTSSLTREILQLKSKCDDAKATLQRSVYAPNVHPSLKVEGRRLFDAYQAAERAKQPLDALLVLTYGLNKEVTNIQNCHAMRHSLVHLLTKIEEMKSYGRTLLKEAPTKGSAVIALAGNLQQRIDSFISSLRDEQVAQDINAFKTDFKRILHLQDTLMNTHRQICNPIVANILIALTGVGLIAILVKAGAQVIDPVINTNDNSFNRRFNYSLFFAKTKSQQHVEAIDEEISLRIPS